MDKLKLTRYSEDMANILQRERLVDVLDIIRNWIEAYGPEAILDIDVDQQYGEYYPRVVVETIRLETDEEYENRIGKDELAKRQKEERERAEYERLKAKFGE